MLNRYSPTKSDKAEACKRERFAKWWDSPKKGTHSRTDKLSDH